MRLTVTPLGASGKSASGVAGAVVDYLEGEIGDRGASMLNRSPENVGAYYADSIEGPGRWLGAGAAFRNLDGVVGRDEFQRVLEGRHPMTGERLVTAQGSSQRSHLSVGTAARNDASGNALYTTRDVARLLGVARADVDELIRAGEDGTERDLDDASWIASTLHPADGPLISDNEVSRHLELAAQPIDANQLRSAGSADDELSVTEAARALRVTPRYVRRICAAFAKAGSGKGEKASLASRRDTSGAFHIRRDDLADFAAKRRVPVARVGFDLTLTAEKSIGLLTMLTTGDRQERLVEAFTNANDTAIAYLDTHASVARSKGNPIATEGLIVASYLHGTSRALDPHPHVHNVVANAAVDQDGGVRTLDARALYRHAPAAAALATAAIRWELRDLGLGWWRRSDGVWEIEGVGESAIREFSQRRAEMDEVRRALEDRLGRTISNREEDHVALNTRSEKQAVDPIGLRTEWLTRADRVGLDVESCFDRADRALAFETLPDDMHRTMFADLVDPTEGLCALSNTFGSGDVMRAIADWSLIDDEGRRRKVVMPPAEVERLTARFCATQLVVEIIGATGSIRRRDGMVVCDSQGEPTFTTIELLDVQSRIVSVVDAGLGREVGTVAPAVIDEAIASADRLSEEQRHLVTTWLTSGDRVQCAVGRAGTGKTTTMRVAARAWTDAGYRVLGAAVKGEAARQLASDAGIDADTVAMLLARSDAGVRVLDSRTVLIVDEASTIGDRDLLRLCELAHDSGAAVRLIGDTAQHGSVAAGGSFAELVEMHATRTPKLETVRRLTDAGERRRADLVREGQVDKALDELEASGQLVVTDSDQDTHAAMVARWYRERAAGRPHPMVHGRNRERRILNSLAQQLLVADGVVHESRSVALPDGRRLCVGDEVVARHGDRSVHPTGDRSGWMRNGTTGQIVDARTVANGSTDDEIDINTVAGVITCNRATFDRTEGGIDLAYAVTSYAVQGATNDVSTSAIGASTSRSELYVDITRGRHRNQLFAARPVTDDNESGAQLPTLKSEVIPVLRGRLARGNARTALALNPTAQQSASILDGLNLAGLHAARRRGDGSAGLNAAITRAEAAVRRVSQHEQPAHVERMLPPCPTSPHLAERWRATVADVAVFVATETPRIRPDQGALPGVIGCRADAADVEYWDETAERLRTTATEIVLRDLVDHLDEAGRDDVASVVRQRSAWLVHHLASRADAGSLPGLNLDRLGLVVEDVERWRAAHDLIGRTAPDAPLGSVPTDPLLRMERAQMQRRLTLRSQPSSGRGVA